MFLFEQKGAMPSDNGTMRESSVAKALWTVAAGPWKGITRPFAEVAPTVRPSLRS